MLCLEQEIERVQLSPTRSPGGVVPTQPSMPAPTSTKSAPASPARGVSDSATTASVDVGYRDGPQRGFFEGLLGCLRPVWTIIGKATQAELKQQGETGGIFIFFNTFCIRSDFHRFKKIYEMWFLEQFLPDKNWCCSSRCIVLPYLPRDLTNWFSYKRNHWSVWSSVLSM